MRRTLVSLAGLMLLGAGCVGPTVSPSDQSLLRDADQLHTRLQSAVMDPRLPRAQRYLEQLAARITITASSLEQQGLIASPDPSGGSNAWMFSADIEVHLVDHPRLSSFAPGGRHVYVYLGLYSQCRGEDELASVLCHEFAHIYARLAQQTIRRSAGDSSETALLQPFAAMRLSAVAEGTASTIAFTLFTRAGWDPTRFASLEQRLLEHPVPDPSIDRAILKLRIDEARRMVDALTDAAREWAKPPVADDARFAQLQGEVKAVAGTRSITRQAQLLLVAFPSCLNLAETPTQAAARAELFTPPVGNTGNQWGKGVPGG